MMPCLGLILLTDSRVSMLIWPLVLLCSLSSFAMELMDKAKGTSENSISNDRMGSAGGFTVGQGIVLLQDQAKSEKSARETQGNYLRSIACCVSVSSSLILIPGLLF